MREVYERLACSQITYRVASKKKMLNEDTGKLASTAFLRYREHDPEGLSLFLGEVDTCEKASRMLNRVYAVGSLHVGHVRDIVVNDIALDIIQDEAAHGYVANLPYVEDDPELAERFATQLLKQCRQCWSR